MTPEQKAKEYANHEFLYGYNQSMTHCLMKGFLAGYQYAQEWISVDTPPEKNGFYICWCCNPEGPGLIHYDKDTGWQNGFYNDHVTHYKLLTPPNKEIKP